MGASEPSTLSQEPSTLAEPAVGVPYTQPPPYGQPFAFNVGQSNGYPAQTYNPVAPPQYRMAPPLPPRMLSNQIPQGGIINNPAGFPLQETFFGDSPAPFECPHCGRSGMTRVKSRFSLATCVACAVSIVGFCFLCPDTCLWHKVHYCPNCDQQVGELLKTDPCAVMDPPQWLKPSYAIPSTAGAM